MLIKDPTQRPDTDVLISFPFINRDLDPKPIRDLLLEYKADVVEEEVVDEEAEVSVKCFLYLILKFKINSNFNALADIFFKKRKQNARLKGDRFIRGLVSVVRLSEM